MILTFTPNPSLDLLFSAPRLVWDDANRLAMPRRRAGGQGINLARAATALGGSARAVAPLGGATGAELAARLAAEAVRLDGVPIRGETRVFVGVRELGSGRNLLLNPHGPRLSGREVEALETAVEEAFTGATWLVCCGSLPPGAPTELYARLGRLARARGLRFVPDCDEEPLSLAAPLAQLLVPNRHEAERLLGERAGAIGGLTDAARAAERLAERFEAERVAVTMGAEGAALHGPAGTWLAVPPPLEEAGVARRAPHAVARRASGDAPGDAPGEAARGAADAGASSAVGAGDAFLAALLLALEAGRDGGAALGDAVAAGTAVLLSRGDALLWARDVRRLRPRVQVRGR